MITKQYVLYRMTTISGFSYTRTVLKFQTQMEDLFISILQCILCQWLRKKIEIEKGAITQNGKNKEVVIV